MLRQTVEQLGHRATTNFKGNPGTSRSSGSKVWLFDVILFADSLSGLLRRPGAEGCHASEEMLPRSFRILHRACFAVDCARCGRAIDQGLCPGR